MALFLNNLFNIFVNNSNKSLQLFQAAKRCTTFYLKRMRKIPFYTIILFLTSIILSCSNKDETQEVYFQVINDTIGLEKKIIIDSTFIRKNEITLSKYEFTFFKKNYKNLQIETYKDFLKKNEKSDKIQLDLEPFKNYEFSSKSYIDKIFETEEEMDKFCKQNKKYIKILHLSNIGFNEDKTQAIVLSSQEGFSCESISLRTNSAGFIYCLEKNKGKWTISYMIPLWIT